MLTILYSGRVPIGPGEGFNVYGIFGLFSRELYEIQVEGSSHKHSGDIKEPIMAKVIDATVEGIEGTIVGFRGSRDSRIAHLVVDGVHVPCDNVTTVKCLHACFGNFIVDGHS